MLALPAPSEGSTAQAFAAAEAAQSRRLSDAGLFMGRSCRVAWSPLGHLAHTGTSECPLLSGVSFSVSIFCSSSACVPDVEIAYGHSLLGLGGDADSMHELLCGRRWA